MSMSGIKVDPSVQQLYNDIKLKKIHKYAGFMLSDDRKKVVIDEDYLGEKIQTETVEEDEKCFNKLKSLLSKEKPRYILYDFGFQLHEGRSCKKIVFLYWCSNDCPIKDKMVYTSTKDTVKKAMQGLGIEFQINDIQDMDYTELMTEVRKRA